MITVIFFHVKQFKDTYCFKKKRNCNNLGRMLCHHIKLILKYCPFALEKMLTTSSYLTFHEIRKKIWHSSSFVRSHSHCTNNEVWFKSRKTPIIHEYHNSSIPILGNTFSFRNNRNISMPYSYEIEKMTCCRLRISGY